MQLLYNFQSLSRLRIDGTFLNFIIKFSITNPTSHSVSIDGIRGHCFYGQTDLGDFVANGFKAPANATTTIEIPGRLNLISALQRGVDVFRTMMTTKGNTFTFKTSLTIGIASIPFDFDYNIKLSDFVPVIP